MSRSLIFNLFLFLFFASFSAASAQGTQLLRQPTVSATDIVFVYANDLWKVSRRGGDAVRLTTNEGYESMPHFSPDGRMIAFSGEYGGNTDVYIIPAEGGSPQRLTWHSSDDVVQGWTPDGAVIFRSSRAGQPTQTNRLYQVSLQGGLPAALPVPRAAYGELSADGRHLAYVPITSWDPEWRNYRGGQAMPIWILELATQELLRIPQTDQERHLDPVWWKDWVYFLSERDYASNIWAYQPATQKLIQVTHHQQFDVKSLDATEDAIVYEQGGYLHLLDPTTGKSEQLTIHVRGDMNFAMPRWEDVPAASLANARLSPSGKRALFEHRGEIFSVPKEEGSWRNLTQNSATADRYPIWSPKGDRIAWFTDASGEYQLVLADQMGQVQKTIELPEASFFFVPDWSPDGRYLTYTDTHYNVWFVDLDSGTAKKIDTDRYAHPNRTLNPTWSPDSKWIAYTKQLDSHFKAIFLYSREGNESYQITDGMADAHSPVWDEDGKYLYLLASRNYGLASGWLDMSSYDPQATYGLYTVLLGADTASPALPTSDEEEAKAEKEESEEEEEKEEKKDIDLTIDITGIQQRIVALKMEEDNYVGLLPAPAGKVFVRLSDDDKQSLHQYDVEKKKAEEFLSDLNDITVSADRKSMLVRQNGSWMIVGTDSKPEKSAENLDLKLRIKIDPQAEYQQIFREGWRYMRDFLYVDNVHGAPWDKIWEWYAPWVDHVRHRTDLNYVVDILSGEVAIGHSYVSGGDMPDLEEVAVGLLGADYTVENGRYRITKIYTGESWNPELTAPLAVAGLDVQEGDYILAVNGHPLAGTDNIYQLMEETVGRTTALEVSDQPTGGKVRTIQVEPIASERGLRTIDWVEGNRRKVDDLSNGQLAYVYVPNTGGGGFTSFNRYYFAQQDRKGVIIDERNNGGGSAADYMIDIMAREPFGYFNSKAGDKRPWTTPIAGIWGPKVMLINERAGSGGDLLPYMFKAKGLGPLIGTRTWGGLVGTWDTPRFIDGGRMVAPRGGFYDLEGNWAVEAEGVAPDIEVIQDPKAVLQGADPQLERGVEEALRLLQTQGFELEPEPAPPVRWKRPDGFKY
jgi:tricorn protease